MYDDILELMRQAVAADRVFLSFHANKELKADRLQFGDIINCILSGEIIEQQLDDSDEKYLLYGDAQNGDELALVAKLGFQQTTLIITVFRLRITDYEY